MKVPMTIETVVNMKIPRIIGKGNIVKIIPCQSFDCNGNNPDRCETCPFKNNEAFNAFADAVNSLNQEE